MKQKGTIYVLLPLAVCLWVYIIYIIAGGLGGHEATGNEPFEMHSMSGSKFSKPDTFVLSLQYEDPFGKLATPVKTKTKAPPKDRKPQPKKQRTTANWPVISYAGSITGVGTTNEVIVLIIKDRDHLTKQGEMVEGIYVESITANEIVLKLNDDTKKIVR